MSARWRQRPEGGNYWAIWLIIQFALRFGRNATRCLLYPITVYFYLRRGPERHAAHSYLARVLNRPARHRDAFRLIHRFASIILDRVFLLSQRFRPFDVQITGLDQLEAQIARGRGVLLLGAHIGSFEVLRVLSRERPELRLCVLLHKAQTPALTSLFATLDPTLATTIIDANQEPLSIVLTLREAAESGAIVALLADRTRPGETSVISPFLGAPARFPAAPFLLGAMLKLPTVLALGMYRGGNRYDIHFETFSEEMIIPRQERQTRLSMYIAQYVARLEYYLRIDPYNWFNLYDFWELGDLPNFSANNSAAISPSHNA